MVPIKQCGFVAVGQANINVAHVWKSRFGFHNEKSPKDDRDDCEDSSQSFIGHALLYRFGVVLVCWILWLYRELCSSFYEVGIDGSSFDPLSCQKQ